MIYCQNKYLLFLIIEYIIYIILLENRPNLIIVYKYHAVNDSSQVRLGYFDQHVKYQEPPLLSPRWRSWCPLWRTIGTFTTVSGPGELPSRRNEPGRVGVARCQSLDQRDLRCRRAVQLHSARIAARPLCAPWTTAARRLPAPLCGCLKTVPAKVVRRVVGLLLLLKSSTTGWWRSWRRRSDARSLAVTSALHEPRANVVCFDRARAESPPAERSRCYACVPYLWRSLVPCPPFGVRHTVSVICFF